VREIVAFALEDSSMHDRVIEGLKCFRLEPAS
jgi:hypothetical protein